MLRLVSICAAVAAVLSGCAAPVPVATLARTQAPAAPPPAKALPAAKAARVVAVAPLALPEGMVDAPAAASREFAEAIERRLRNEGITVIPTAELVTAAEEALAARQGQADPATPQPLQAELIAVARERYHAEVILWPSVVEVIVAFSSSQATWDGILDNVGTGFQLKRWRGLVKALSLRVTVTDLDGAILYAKAGGIQVRSKVAQDGVIFPVPRETLLADHTRNATAVRLAVDDYTGASKKVTGSMGSMSR